MSAELNWLIVRNTSSFIVKKRNIRQRFSKEPHNLKNIHSFRYSGICQGKMVGIEPAKDGKGLVLVNKKTKYVNKPAKHLNKSTIKHGARRTLRSVKNFFSGDNYRKDLKMAALRRASAVLRSQRQIQIKKKGGPRKKAE